MRKFQNFQVAARPQHFKTPVLYTFSKKVCFKDTRNYLVYQSGDVFVWRRFPKRAAHSTWNNIVNHREAVILGPFVGRNNTALFCGCFTQAGRNGRNGGRYGTEKAFKRLVGSRTHNILDVRKRALLCFGLRGGCYLAFLRFLLYRPNELVKAKLWIELHIFSENCLWFVLPIVQCFLVCFTGITNSRTTYLWNMRKHSEAFASHGRISVKGFLVVCN